MIPGNFPVQRGGRGREGKKAGKGRVLGLMTVVSPAAEFRLGTLGASRTPLRPRGEAVSWPAALVEGYLQERSFCGQGLPQLEIKPWAERCPCSQRGVQLLIVEESAEVTEQQLSSTHLPLQLCLQSTYPLPHQNVWMVASSELIQDAFVTDPTQQLPPPPPVVFPCGCHPALPRKVQ